MSNEARETPEATEPRIEEDQRADAAGLSEEEKVAEEAFASGFEAVASGRDVAGQQKQEPSRSEDAQSRQVEEKPEPAAPEKAREVAAIVDPWDGVSPVVREQLEALSKLPDQLRNLAGHVGGLKSQLNTALAAAKAAAERRGDEAPSEAQVNVALADPKAMERLMEDFPDLAGPVANELRAIHQRIGQMSPGVDAQVVEAMRAQVKSDALRELRMELVDDAHEGWRDLVKTEQFKTWFASQPDAVKSLAQSDRATDAIKLLDAHRDSVESAAKAAKDKEVRKRRLEAAVSPIGSAGSSDAGLSDQAAFERGFKQVARVRSA